FFSSRRRHTRFSRDWSSDVCSSDLKVLLLDEPTGGMNRHERLRTGELIRQAAATCAVVIVEHDLDFIRDLCDRITVLHQGTRVRSEERRVGKSVGLGGG